MGPTYYELCNLGSTDREDEDGLGPGDESRRGGPPVLRRRRLLSCGKSREKEVPVSCLRTPSFFAVHHQTRTSRGPGSFFFLPLFPPLSQKEILIFTFSFSRHHGPRPTASARFHDVGSGWCRTRSVGHHYCSTGYIQHPVCWIGATGCAGNVCCARLRYYCNSRPPCLRAELARPLMPFWQRQGVSPGPSPSSRPLTAPLYTFEPHLLLPQPQ